MPKERELDFFDNELPNCNYCTYSYTNDKGIFNARCRAFPDGIPMIILSNELFVVVST